MRRYGVGILGAGWVASRYVAAFRDHPRTDIVGIHSRTLGRGQQLLESHGVLAPEFKTEAEFFGNERLDIVVSCTPPGARRDHVLRAAALGRHVMLEKPIALTGEAVIEMRDAISRAGVKSITSFVLRWNPQLQRIKQLVVDGVIGDLLYAEADYWHPLPEYLMGSWLLRKDEGGSAFVGAGCHAADAMRYLCGEIADVAALSAGPKILSGFEYDPVVVASLKFENGAVGKLSTLLEGNTPHIFNVRLFGTEGSIQNNRVFSGKRYPDAVGYREFQSVPPDSPEGQHPFEAEIAHFIDCIEADVESHASIHDTWKSMALCFAIDESASNGGSPVTVMNAEEEHSPRSRAQHPPRVPGA